MRLFIATLLLSTFCSCNQQNSTENASLNDSISSAETAKLDETLAEDSALTAINLQIRAEINNPDLYLKRSAIYEELGDSKSALEDLDRAYRIDSLYLPTSLAQADYLARMGKLEIALKILERAKAKNPTAAPVYVSYSKWNLIAKNAEQALKNADLAIKYDKFNAEAYYLKGYSFLNLGDTTRAISSHRTAIEQDPDYFEPYVELGLIFSQKNDPLAIEYYKNALEVKPRDKGVLYSKGLFEQEHELYNEAIQTYTDAIKFHPDFKEAYYNLGYVHMYYLKMYREGTRYFTDAVEVEPNYYQAYYNRGYCFELLGDITNAAKDYRKALSIQPDYDLAAKGLSRVTEGI